MRILYHPGLQLCNINYTIDTIDFTTGTIGYSFNSGRLPMTVELIGVSSTQTNIHSTYGSYSFIGVVDGDYELKFTDNIGCIQSEFIIGSCETCPEGYEPYQDGCIKYEYVNPTYYETTYTIVKTTSNAAYSVNGPVIFNEGWNYNGTGTYERILPNTNTYWHNTPYPSLTGVMNRTSVWSSTTRSNQDIGFSFCVDIAIGKNYYVGFGCDNVGKIKLNGNYILEQDLTAIKSMFSSSDNGITFKYWFIYPVFLPAGENIIEVLGWNDASVAAIGIQIYDATKQDLKNATNANPLGSKILFSSESLAGQLLHYEYSDTYGYHGYVCPTGYALDTCGETFVCTLRDVIEECPEPVGGCVEYGYLYNWYAATDSRKITSSDDWIVSRFDIDAVELNNYIGGSSQGFKLKETGTIYWTSPNNNATNEVGFGARAAGHRYNDGNFYALQQMFYFWSDTAYDSSNAILAAELYESDIFFVSSNSVGLSYANKVSGMSVRFVRTSTTLSHGETGTYIGNDGKIYQTICIGNQEWLAENLAETKYRNGDPIPTVENNATWAGLTTGAKCAYNNDYSLVGCGEAAPEQPCFDSYNTFDVVAGGKLINKSIDGTTALIALPQSGWSAGASGFTSWDNALVEADSLLANGFSDWRLPTVEEWNTIGFTSNVSTALGWYDFTYYWTADEIDSTHAFRWRTSDDSTSTYGGAYNTSTSELKTTQWLYGIAVRTATCSDI